ncbi:MAG TPA: DUF1801 domain-containing protein [Sphingomonas sp.]|jgi:hypothetical protein|uniref:DUF1801 domain-containing protein n=1 Tax=Sphingomonas sp. TaxID=28214 RepID=UPI002ED8C317
MTDAVEALLAGVSPPERQADARALAALMARVTDMPPAAWGTMIGFGRYHYRYESGREGEAMRIGFAPRKSELVVYVMGGFPGHEALLARLGKHRAGKSCLYVKRLADIDAGVLEELVGAAWWHMAELYPDQPGLARG